MSSEQLPIEGIWKKDAKSPLKRVFVIYGIYGHRIQKPHLSCRRFGSIGRLGVKTRGVICRNKFAPSPKNL
ncbi:MAG: hypothetical protein A3D44_03285 [Candidatus Staskawiczbacteria bacterium RIFCSPHIGHO2_02_FULL_42_22]|uniref:Uncharacterized protein n=1 Tax=Candidatus Staskawiczbacteria bacterium RIFCSPHIGHO2_02_FULL_42_22 TaxID=1802207 RepID=A0A1G2I419_9BACT|nr:MAG: hypothetical protein A3D44_03285 [Candidatus Staskawiczbacteria bacterium RIFCSPHIGHO2_02_FULL_42_22]